MKYILPVLLFSVQAHAYVVDLRSDQAVYSLQSEAVLLASVVHAPVNPSVELYFEAQLNDTPVKVVRLTEKSALSLSPVLAVAGEQHWKVKVYWQNKQMAKGLQKTILFYQSEVKRIEGLLTTETDPVKIAALQAELAKDNSRIVSAQNALIRERTLIEEDQLDFAVSNTDKSLMEPESVLSLSLDHPSYRVGDAATLTTTINVGFEGKESVLSTLLDGQPLASSFVDGHYITTSAPLTTLGTHTFSVAYQVISKSQADLLRDALSGAHNTLSELVVALNTETDTAERLYIESEIKDLRFAVDGIETQIVAALDHVVTQTISFEVTE